MSKMTLEYTEKHHMLEVDGIEYEIPQRTAELEAKIKEHDEKVKEMSEYDGNMSLLEIFFGKKNSKKMFPDKASTNLNKLAKCVRLATAMYLADYMLMKDASIKEQLDSMEQNAK